MWVKTGKGAVPLFFSFFLSFLLKLRVLAFGAKCSSTITSKFGERWVKVQTAVVLTLSLTVHALPCAAATEGLGCVFFCGGGESPCSESAPSF